MSVMILGFARVGGVGVGDDALTWCPSAGVSRVGVL